MSSGEREGREEEVCLYGREYYGLEEADGDDGRRTYGMANTNSRVIGQPVRSEHHGRVLVSRACGSPGQLTGGLNTNTRPHNRR